jgi:hypothetical protein
MESIPIARIMDSPGGPDGLWVEKGCADEPSAIGARIRLVGDYPPSIELLAKVFGFPDGLEASQPVGRGFDAADSTVA